MLSTRTQGGDDYIAGIDYPLPLPPAPAVAAQAPAPKVEHANPLRPTTFDAMIGQSRLKSMLRRMIAASKRSGQPLAHTLLVGASGTGKTTIAVIVGNELGATVHQVEAPVSHETLLSLRKTMRDGDILFIDEVHQQAIQERRGKSSATQPEVLFNVMEDRTLVSGTGLLDFPAISVIAATTDEGMLPDAFINRFPLRPVIERYTQDDMVDLAYANAVMLDTTIALTAAHAFAGACRATPRVLNNYMRNAVSLSDGEGIDLMLAMEVLDDLECVTTDGLTRDMQNVLTFLLKRARRTNQATGVTTYQASVGTIATAIGKSRDQKAVQLRIEPYLIECGFLQVGHGGRSLTDAGIQRASQLLP